MAMKPIGSGTHAQRILALLVAAKGRWVSRAALLEAMYWDDPDGGPLTANACLTLAIFKLRALLGREAIEVEHRTGYRITDRANPDRINKFLPPVDLCALLRDYLDYKAAEPVPA